MSLDLEPIKARDAAATPGPWYLARGGEINDPLYAIAAVLRDAYGDNSLTFGSDKPTGEFVAHARTDVPALVAEVEELRADLRIANEATLELLRRAVKAEDEAERLRCVAGESGGITPAAILAELRGPLGGQP